MPVLHDQSTPTREKVLVAGAGPAGLAAAAALAALRIPFDLVDPGSDVGGIWSLGEDTPVWDSMHPISSREMTQFEDLLMPVSFPDFPSPEDLGKYLRAYAARYDLTAHFRPGVSVRSAEPFEEGVWQVELSNGEVGVYRAIISATGTSARPHLPAWAIDPNLSGLRDLTAVGGPRLIHSRDWTGADSLQGRTVLVVGSGQSAADIAVDASRSALEVRWSVRTGHWIVPRTIGGVPGDVAASREPALLGPLNEKIAEAVIRRTMGNVRALGLPAPEAPLLSDRVIVSDDILPRIREGRVRPVADVTGMDDEGRVSLADGSDWNPSVIVLATGYEHGPQFLPEGLIPRTDSGSPDLFLGAFPRTRDDLAVLGQMRTVGGIWPLLAQQADIAALFLHAQREDPAAAEAFRRLRSGSDHRVSARAASQPGRPTEGLRGRLASGLEHLQDLARRPAAVTPVRETGQLPFVDRADALARLRRAREVFGEDGDRDDLPRAAH